MELKREHIPRLLVFAILTLGFSLIPWAWRFSKQTRQALEAFQLQVPPSPSRVAWLTVITLGFYWFYAMGDRLAMLAQLADRDASKFPWGVVHLVVAISGHPLASVVLMQMEMNRLADSHVLKSLENKTSDESTQEGIASSGASDASTFG